MLKISRFVLALVPMILLISVGSVQAQKQQVNHSKILYDKIEEFVRQVNDQYNGAARSLDGACKIYLPNGHSASKNDLVSNWVLPKIGSDPKWEFLGDVDFFDNRSVIVSINGTASHWTVGLRRKLPDDIEWKVYYIHVSAR